MIGLVLEGGGAKGAYHIGAYRALRECGIQIDGVTGTSIGAINGAVIVQGDGDKAWDLWAGMSNSRLFEIDPESAERLRRDGLTLETLPDAAALVRKVFAERGIDTTKIKAFIDEHVNEGRVRASGMDFGLVTVSFTDREPLELMLADIPEGKLTEYILASASLPGFKTAPVDGRQFVDGGIWNNLPLSLLADRGYDTLIAVRTDAVGQVRPADDFGIRIVMIEPSRPLGSLLDFSEGAARRHLMLGYLDTLRIYRDLRGKRFFISSHPDREWAFHHLSNLESERIRETGRLLGIPDMPPRRMLFEHIVPKLADIFQLNDAMDYEDLWVALLEGAAESVGLESLKLYSIEELSLEIADAYADSEPTLPQPASVLAKYDPRLGRLVKDDIVHSLTGIFFGNRGRF